MSKRTKWIIVIILVLVVLLVADFMWNGKVSQIWHNIVSSPSSSSAPSPSPLLEGEVHQNYFGKVFVDFQKHKLSGLVQIQATNKTALDQSAIYFHLYPNAFRDLNNLRGENWDYVLGDKRIPGWIDIRSVSINGKAYDFEVNDTILKIPLATWESGGKVDVAIDFELQVPKNNSRLSYDDHSIWLGNWLPILAEYDENGWYLDPYHPIGDPFYSDVANYELEIDVPAGHHIASSGNEVEQQVTVVGERQHHKVAARSVRDFALVIMDETYTNIRTAIGNHLIINTWYRSTDQKKLAQELHQAGVDSLSYFADTYGPYPYQEYDIVRTGGFFGGMEYPGIVFVQGQYFEEQDDYGIIVVAHETAHQWWYGIVGNNEVSDPWMDESLAQYSTLRFLLENYGSIGRSMLKSSEKVAAASERFERSDEYVGSSVDQFSNWDSYGTLVYYKGLQMFYQLEQAIGLDKMNQILSDYVQQYQFKNTTDEELIIVFEKYLGEQVRNYFQAWLSGEQIQFVH